MGLNTHTPTKTKWITWVFSFYFLKFLTNNCIFVLIAECRDGIGGGWMWTPYLCRFFSLCFFSFLFFLRVFSCVRFISLFLAFLFFCLSTHVYLLFFLFLFLFFRAAHRVLLGIFFPVRSLSNPAILSYFSVWFSFYPGQRRQMWQSPSTPSNTLTSQKHFKSWPVIQLVVRWDISHFSTATRNTTEGVGEKRKKWTLWA